MIPDLIMLTFLPVTTSIPSPTFNLSGQSKLALFNITSNGFCIAFNNIASPSFSGNIVVDAFNKAIPPPGTIPSCNAAFVAYIASSTLSLFSFNSTCEFAPTKTIPTLPDNIAILSFSFFFI